MPASIYKSPTSSRCCGDGSSCKPSGGRKEDVSSQADSSRISSHQVTTKITKDGWYRHHPSSKMFEDYNPQTGGLDHEKVSKYAGEPDDDDPWTYVGKRLQHLEFPLGGFGTGQILFQGDGTLQGWTVQNNFQNQEYTPLTQLPGNMFGIQTRFTDEEQSRAKSYVLQTPQNYTVSNVHNHGVTDAQIQRMQKMPGIRSLKAKCQYPIATIEYDIPDFQIDVKVECMTPLIPGNSKDSSLPMAIFTFTLTNTTNRSVDVSLLQSTLNFVGWDGQTSIVDPVNQETPFWKGNVNTPIVQERAYAGWSMTSTSTPKCACQNDSQHQDGSLSLVAIHNPNTKPGLIVKSSESEQYLWEDFVNGNILDPTSCKATDPSYKGCTYIGGVTQNMTLPPNTTETCQFVLSWYFPHRVNYAPRPNLPKVLGNMYSNWFGNSTDVVDYFVSKADFLATTTHRYVQTMYSTTIPYELLESAAGRLCVMRCPSMFWTKDGTVLFNEGNNCCPLNCTHVIGYTFLLERLYPDLAQNILKSNFITNFDPTKGCTMRYGAGGFAIDGSLACVIKVYLAVLQGDSKLKFLQEVWPNVKRTIEIYMDQADDHDRVFRCWQQNTYDTAMQGANTFIGSYWITSLKAATVMARLMNDSSFASLCDQTWKTAAVAYERICWKEEYQYYIADVDKDTCKNSYGPGCFVDQLSAVGLSLAAGFGTIFNPDHEAAARRAIFQNNSVQKPPFQDLQKHFYDGDKGVCVNTYPHGKLPGCYVYDDLVSIGFSYPVVAAMIHDEGDNKQQALEWARNIRGRHSGVNRSPWNEPECGLLYTRAMASWGLFDQSCGFHYDATKASLSYAPKFKATEFSCFAIVENGWGQIRNYWQGGDLGQGRIEIECQYGSMKLASISTPHLKGTAGTLQVLSASVGGQRHAVSIDSHEGTIQLSSLLNIMNGTTLVVVVMRTTNKEKTTFVPPKKCYPKLSRMLLLLLICAVLVRLWLLLNSAHLQHLTL